MVGQSIQSVTKREKDNKNICKCERERGRDGMINSERKYKSAQRSRETDCLILCFPLISVELHCVLYLL